MQSISRMWPNVGFYPLRNSLSHDQRISLIWKMGAASGLWPIVVPKLDQVPQWAYGIVKSDAMTPTPPRFRTIDFRFHFIHVAYWSYEQSSKWLLTIWCPGQSNSYKMFVNVVVKGNHRNVFFTILDSRIETAPNASIVSIHCILSLAHARWGILLYENKTKTILLEPNFIV